MKNKKLLIGLLTLLLIITLGLNLFQIQKNKATTAEVQEIFKEHLLQASNELSFDLSAMKDEGRKAYFYNKSVTSLSAATALSQFTGYQKINSSLSVSLFNLYTQMTDPALKDSFIQENERIHNLLLDLASDPTNISVTKKLDDLTQEIRLSIK